MQVITSSEKVKGGPNLTAEEARLICSFQRLNYEAKEVLLGLAIHYASDSKFRRAPQLRVIQGGA